MLLTRLEHRCAPQWPGIDTRPELGPCATFRRAQVARGAVRRLLQTHIAAIWRPFKPRGALLTGSTTVSAPPVGLDRTAPTRHLSMSRGPRHCWRTRTRVYRTHCTCVPAIASVLHSAADAAPRVQQDGPAASGALLCAAHPGASHLDAAFVGETPPRTGYVVADVVADARAWRRAVRALGSYC